MPYGGVRVPGILLVLVLGILLTPRAPDFFRGFCSFWPPFQGVFLDAIEYVAGHSARYYVWEAASARARLRVSIRALIRCIRWPPPSQKRRLLCSSSNLYIKARFGPWTRPNARQGLRELPPCQPYPLCPYKSAPRAVEPFPRHTGDGALGVK